MLKKPWRRCTVPLPPEIRALHSTPEGLQEALYSEHRIEAAIVDFGGRWHVRASAQIYNAAEEYERLAQAVIELSERA